MENKKQRWPKSENVRLAPALSGLNSLSFSISASLFLIYQFNRQDVVINAENAHERLMKAHIWPWLGCSVKSASTFSTLSCSPSPQDASPEPELWSRSQLCWAQPDVCHLTGLPAGNCPGQRHHPQTQPWPSAHPAQAPARWPHSGATPLAQKHTAQPAVEGWELCSSLGIPGPWGFPLGTRL